MLYTQHIYAAKTLANRAFLTIHVLSLEEAVLPNTNFNSQTKYLTF